MSLKPSNREQIKRTPPPTSPSATMLLLRERETLEVFMVVRHEKLDFGSGALVFPGGKLDAADSAPDLRNFCEEADKFSHDDLAHRVTAIREAFEEAGILLARDAKGEIVCGRRLEELSLYRKLLDRGEIDISAFLQAESLTLTCGALEHFAHWITPLNRHRRFDTHFYIAAAPDDHDAMHDGHESVHSIWAEPSRVLHQAEEGLWHLMPPTVHSLKRLARFSTIEDALEDARTTPVVTIGPFDD